MEKFLLDAPFKALKKKVHDFGNITRSQIENIYDKISASSKIPISIGGDHSITRQIINTLAKKHGKISLAYFDAHPDFVLILCYL